MNTTRTIQVFLASSEELKADRNTFGNLIRRLDNIYEKRGIRIKLFEWEDCDAAYNNRRKQDEYNDEVRASDMFLAFFYKKAGKFTVEEFDVATEEFQRTGIKPKPYVYCRDLPEGEQETEELKEFKRHLIEELEYFWMRYNNEDSLLLHFVMQLQLVENSRLDKLKVENGEVKLDGTTIARMEHLRFAADNPDYQSMSNRLHELPSLIEHARLRVEKYPDDQNLIDDLQKLYDEKNQLQKDFDQHQQFLFDTAKRIATLQGEAITDRMRRAIEAFEKGNVREANIILDEAEHDATRNLADYQQSKTLTEQKRQNVIRSIKEILLKTSTLMADASIDINERIERVHSIYSQADEMAKNVDYDKEKYFNLLFDYARFLFDYGLYHDAEGVYLREIALSEALYGLKDECTATSYNNIGALYKNQGNYSMALEYYFKALNCKKKIFSIIHQSEKSTLFYTLYINIGSVYHNQGNHTKALEYYFKALSIVEKVLGQDHTIIASIYNNIGVVYLDLGASTKALEYCTKALRIARKTLELEHPYIAFTYNNIGMAYSQKEDYGNALNNYEIALSILKNTLGTNHPKTATTYNNIGSVFHDKGDYTKALEYYNIALTIDVKTLGRSHPETASTYNNIGLVYKNRGDNSEALDYYLKALSINEEVLGSEHPLTAISYNNIGMIYDGQSNYSMALEYFEKSLAIREKVFGTFHSDTASDYNNIGAIYCKMKKYDKALKYFNKSLEIYRTILGPDHYNTRNAEAWIVIVNTIRGENNPKKKTFWQRLFGK